MSAVAKVMSFLLVSSQSQSLKSVFTGVLKYGCLALEKMLRFAAKNTASAEFERLHHVCLAVVDTIASSTAPHAKAEVVQVASQALRAVCNEVVVVVAPERKPQEE